MILSPLGYAIRRGAYSDSWTPAELDSTELDYWFKADAGVTESGGAVSAWADQSGNGNDITQATAGYQPTYVDDYRNGLPAIVFDGVDDYIDRSSLTQGTISNPFRIYAVYKMGALDTGFRSLVSNATNNQQLLYINGSSGSSPAIYGGSAYNTGTQPDVGSFNIINGLHASGTGSLRNISTGSTGLSYSVGSAGSLAKAGVKLGYYGYINSFHNSAILEVLQVPSDDEELNAKIEGYLQRRYDIESAWSPAVLGPSTLAYWYKADTGVTESGGSVSVWADQSGNGNSVSQGNAAYQPTLVDDVQNGLPEILFNQDYLIRSNLTQGLIDQPITTIIVGKNPSGTAGVNTYLVTNSGLSGVGDRLDTQLNNVGSTPGMYPPALNGSTAVTWDSDFIRVDIADTASSELRYKEAGNSYEVTTGSSTGRRAGISVGTYQSSPTYGFKGHIGEIVGLATADTEIIDQVIEYLEAKWSI